MAKTARVKEDDFEIVFLGKEQKEKPILISMLLQEELCAELLDLLVQL